MKPFDLSQYMFNVAQAAGAGLMGYDAAIDYADGTVGAAIKASGGGGGGLPPSTMAEFNDACTDGNFAFQTNAANFSVLTVTGNANFQGIINAATTTNPITIGSTTAAMNFGTAQTTAQINIGSTTGTGGILIGMSNGSQSLWLGGGSTTAASVKNINIGTGGVSGSNTIITYGSTTAGAIASHRFNGTVDLNGQTNILSVANPVFISPTTGSLFLGSSSTTGPVTIGSAAGTGIIELGVSTASQTVGIAKGATASGSVKTVGIGANGLSGSTTNITFGSAVAGATNSYTFNTGAVKSANFTVDTNYYITMLSSNPIINFDANDYLVFDRPSNQWNFVSNSVAVAAFAAASSSISGELVINGNTLWIGGGTRMLMQHDGNSGFFRIQNNSNLYFGVNASSHLVMNTGAFAPVTDNTMHCGTGAQRWAAIWAFNGTIQTSDAREKKWRGGFSAAEMVAAKEIAQGLGVYQWLSSIEEKGIEQARLHIGVTAQGVKAVMEKHGLEVERYGFFCYDEWEEVVHPGGEGAEDIVVPAGDRYSVRYDELAMFIAAAQQQKQDELEARIAALESGG